MEMNIEIIVIGFIVIVVLGALFGGKSFGGVIATGIFVATLLVVAFVVFSEYKNTQALEEYKEVQKQIERDEKLKEEMLEDLSVESKKSTDSNFLHFTNNCNKDVDLHIHFLNESGEWETRGSWEFTASESAYLTSNDRRLTTNNSILFYHISGKNIDFRGKHKFKEYDETYYMKKINDNYDTTEWSYSCN